jgi:hypothetical protein
MISFSASSAVAKCVKVLIDGRGQELGTGFVTSLKCRGLLVGGKQQNSYSESREHQKDLHECALLTKDAASFQECCRGILKKRNIVSGSRIRRHT